MIILILVAVLWIAVLVPSVISKLRERRSAGSIGRFHERLDLLERTGPKLVEPAYRLTGTDAGHRSNDPVVVAAPPPPVRPTLTLVQPADDVGSSESSPWEPASPIALENVVMHAYEASEEYSESEDGPSETDELSEPDRRSLMALNRRRAARRRRRDVFAALCALTALTGLLGLARPLREAWVVSGLFFTLLVAFVGLAMYGQRVESERRHLAKLYRVEQTRIEEPDGDSPTIKYLSQDELARYHEALSNYYEEEDIRLVARA